MPIDKITGRWRETKVDVSKLAWAAGFFDGEGSSGCYENGPNVRLALSVTQKELLPLVKFKKAILGIGTIREWKGINKLHAHGFENVQAIIAMLWFELTPIKREQYKRALKLYNELYKPNLENTSRSRFGERVRERAALKRIK